MRFLQVRVRDDLAQLSPRRSAAAACIAALALSPVLAAAAATPTPSPKPHMVTVKKQIKPQLPTVPLHATYTVETNKLGQVVRVRSVEPSKNEAFDAMTYGNSLQAFIRHPDGSAVAGVYKLRYDYSPQTKKVRREVELVQAGGVNPDAPGAVTVELEKDAKTQAQERARAAKATPTVKLPDFNQIVSPSPKP